MACDWNVKIWGVRGSFPRSLKEGQIFGGNTACISVNRGETAFVLDAGSGIAAYAQEFQREKTNGRLNILISHFHIDHVMGLFYFYPMFDPDLEIHFYGGEGLQDHLEALVRKPYWPVAFSEFPAKVACHEISAGSSFQVEDVRIDTMEGVHPEGSILYRLSDGEKSLVYTLDCEMTEEIRPKLTEFSKDCDLLIWDADYTAEDLRPGWGHSTWEQGIAMRGACGAKKVVMTHYSWKYTDEYILQQEQEAAGQDAACCFAREGMVLAL